MGNTASSSDAMSGRHTNFNEREEEEDDDRKPAARQDMQESGRTYEQAIIVDDSSQEGEEEEDDDRKPAARRDMHESGRTNEQATTTIDDSSMEGDETPESPPRQRPRYSNHSMITRSQSRCTNPNSNVLMDPISSSSIRLTIRNQAHTASRRRSDSSRSRTRRLRRNRFDTNRSTDPLIIRSLVSYTIKDVEKEVPKDRRKCCICLDEFMNGQKRKKLQCQHAFHKECIDEWLKRSTQCPHCRFDVQGSV
ncbi:hypothetical protein CTEN210_13638 [Chaetoceros tenuissimus]|uniref:RING-type domain-containing protein n=1 Tax=Chaetoceros tenuissimus TaxID=426638 RepID=A0AAD3D3D8_9STRA|nr:hypothetical protein CTEN210_13638 [Chaetoceros tenuissimus]